MDKYSPTRINDGFDFDKLECPYYDICKFYNPQGDNCKYNKYCNTCLTFGNIKIPIREILRNCLENYVTLENLKIQIKEIDYEDK
ncbi:MAG: hypothetical protein ACTSQA_00130 [Candidatus Heimdallarchaeaceae archaeon]